MKSKITTLIFFLSLFVLLNSCDNRNSINSSERSINFRYTVLNLSVEELYYLGKDFDNLWTPDSSQLLAAEFILEKAVSELQEEHYRLSTISLPNYYRQYVCFKNNQGERIIWINAFCEVLDIQVERNGTFELAPFNWKEDLVHVDDGEDCYWNILINLDKGEYYDFLINGVG